jgi:hypothetical protein
LHTSADGLILAKFGLRHALPIGEIDLDHGQPIRPARRTSKRGTIIAPP